MFRYTPTLDCFLRVFEEKMQEKQNLARNWNRPWSALEGTYMYTCSYMYCQPT